MGKSRSKLAALFGAVIVIGGGGFIVVHGGGGGGQTGNVWLAPNGSNAGSNCHRFSSAVTNPDATGASLCATFAQGCTLASAGDNVMVMGTGGSGFYTVGSFTCSKGSTTTFTAVTGQTVKVSNRITLNATNITFNGPMQFAGISTDQGSNITLNNVDSFCADVAPYPLTTDGAGGSYCDAGIHIWAATGNLTNFTWNGGTVGPSYDCSGTGGCTGSAIGGSQTGSFNNPAGLAPSNVTFKGIRFHDNRRKSDLDHTECLMVQGANNLKILNSSFDHCAVFDIFFTWWNFVSPQYPQMHDVLVENSQFGSIVGGCTPTGPNNCAVGNIAMQFSTHNCSVTNVTLQYNTAVNAPNNYETGTSDCGSAMVYTSNFLRGNALGGNAAFSTGCPPSGWVMSFNITTGGACGTGQVNMPNLTLVNANGGNPNGGNWTPATGSPLINAGNSTTGQYPTTDFNGTTRFCGSAADVGSIELCP